MLTALLTVILSAVKMMANYMSALFILMVESAFFGAVLWFLYSMVNGKLELPTLTYIEVCYILLGVKILKFSTFDMINFLSDSPQNQTEHDQKNDES